MPDWVRFVRSHLRLDDLRRERADEIVEDLARQLEDCYREALGRGLTEQQAEQHACAQIRDWDNFVSDLYRTNRRNRNKVWDQTLSAPLPAARRTQGGITAMFTDLKLDLLYGLRLLRRSPGFTAVAVLTLALGIGANTAIFSVIQGVLIRPLPYEKGENIVFISEWSEQVPSLSFSVENFKDLRDQNTVFEAIGAQRFRSYILTGSGEPERVSAREVTTGLFSALRLQPLVGRLFSPDEDKVGASRVALLGEGFWTRRFGRDPGIVNKQLVLDGEPFTVIGVLPGTMHRSLRDIDVFTSLLRREDQLGGPENRGNHPGIYVYARRKPGVSEEQARTEVTGIAQRLAETYPDTNARRSMTLQSLKEALVEDDRPALLLLMGAVGLVLLIACANVANLLLGRAATRRREIAVRTALGAERGRLMRQLLTESVLLALAGGLTGVLLGYWGLRGLLAALPENAARIEGVQLNGAVLAFTTAVALLTGLLFGIVPAWQASRTDAHETLKEGGRGGTAGKSHHRVRGTLVIVETALAFILLVGTGLMLKSFLRVLQADAGFNAEGVLTANVSGPETKYGEPERQRAFIEQILNRVQAIPGVEYASAALPLLGGWQTSFRVEGRPEAPPGQQPSVDFTRISPDYFRAMGIHLLEGRFFTDQDQADAPEVCIIDERFAQSYWPGESPLGKRVAFGRPDPDNPWMEVVGVVNHVKNYGVDQESRVEIYLPYKQEPISSFTLVIRTGGDPARLTSAVRQAVQVVDPDVPIFEVRTLESIVADRVAQRKLAAILISVFGGLALALAAVGIYSVMSYSVTQRSHEMGIRMALGARRHDIVKLVVRQGLVLAALGLVIGFGVSYFGLSRLMTAVLFQVSATDPPTYSVSPLILVVVALLACWIPARRATRVDPMVALRYE